jgi:hypothetical protein
MYTLDIKYVFHSYLKIVFLNLHQEIKPRGLLQAIFRIFNTLQALYLFGHYVGILNF